LERIETQVFVTSVTETAARSAWPGLSNADYRMFHVERGQVKPWVTSAAAIRGNNEGQRAN
jgi:hypothetical protein